jgi:predicted nucleic acid-binding Zn ribbon protein
MTGTGPPQPSDDSEPRESSGIDLARATLAAARARSKDPGVTQRGSGRRRGGYGERSGSGPDERDPQLLSSAIPRMIEDRGWTVPAAVGGVMGRWPEIVGSHIAAHCTPVEFNDGVLTVRTDSPAWATELRMLAPQLLAKLNSELGTKRPASTGVPQTEPEGAISLLKVIGPGGR